MTSAGLFMFYPGPYGGAVELTKYNCPIELELMKPEDTAEAVDLIAASMNADEGTWAKETFDFYFACLE